MHISTNRYKHVSKIKCLKDNKIQSLKNCLNNVYLQFSQRFTKLLPFEVHMKDDNYHMIDVNYYGIIF